MSSFASRAVCGGVVDFADGTPTRAALTFSYASNVTYSSALNGGAPFTYSPSPTPEGYDANHSWNTHCADRLDERRDELRAIRALRFGFS